MKLTEGQAKKLSRKLSVMKSDNVDFEYEYWLDLNNFKLEAGQEQPVVLITGQFNDWDIEPMDLDITGSKENQNVDTQGKLRYTYTKQVKGGQIYNYYLIING